MSEAKHKQLQQASGTFAMQLACGAGFLSDAKRVQPCKGVKRCNQRHWFLLDPESTNCLCLPCLEFQGGLCEFVAPRTSMLEVIEPGAAGNLESGPGANVAVQHKLGRGGGSS